MNRGPCTAHTSGQAGISPFTGLNLCRIMYSFQEHDAVVSKRFSGIWAGGKFPQWSTLIQAALRTYEDKSTPADENQLQADMESFLEFTLKYIDECPGASRT